MAKTHRPWGVYAGPVIFVAGLGVVWGVQGARALKDKVEDWEYRLEQTAEPVAMDNPLPYFPLFIDGAWVGGLDSVVVLRSEVGTVDSVRVVVSMRAGDDGRYDDCIVRFRARDLEPPFFEYALGCATDAEGLVPFGHVSVSGTDVTIPLLVRPGELPCDRFDLRFGACDDTSAEIHVDLAQIRDQVEREVGQVRQEIRRSIEEAQVEVQAAVRESIR